MRARIGRWFEPVASTHLDARARAAGRLEPSSSADTHAPETLHICVKFDKRIELAKVYAAFERAQPLVRLARLEDLGDALQELVQFSLRAGCQRESSRPCPDHWESTGNDQCRAPRKARSPQHYATTAQRPRVAVRLKEYGVHGQLCERPATEDRCLRPFDVDGQPYVAYQLQPRHLVYALNLTTGRRHLVGAEDAMQPPADGNGIARPTLLLMRGLKLVAPGCDDAHILAEGEWPEARGWHYSLSQTTVLFASK